MIRRVILATCALGVLAGVAGSTLAYADSSGTRDQQLCVVLSKDANHHNTEYYCIDWDGLPAK